MPTFSVTLPVSELKFAFSMFCQWLEFLKNLREMELKVSPGSTT